MALDLLAIGDGLLDVSGGSTFSRPRFTDEAGTASFVLFWVAAVRKFCDETGCSAAEFSRRKEFTELDDGLRAGRFLTDFTGLDVRSYMSGNSSSVSTGSAFRRPGVFVMSVLFLFFPRGGDGSGRDA